MGIAPYKTFIFDGESSIDYGVYLTGEGVFNAPERAVEMITIPGRNGAFALDQGRFENIEITYKAGMVDVNESNFADKMSAFRNWLCSKVGYCRLEDDYNPNEFRMAVFKNGIEVEHDFLIAGEFEITFECKPQRWLTSGETATAITSGDTVTNPTLFEAHPLLEVEGYGNINIGSSEIVVNDAPIGDIQISERTRSTTTTAGGYGNITVNFDNPPLNTGDVITVSDVEVTFEHLVRSGYTLISASADQTTNCICSITENGRFVKLSSTPVTFQYETGSPLGVDVSVSAVINWNYLYNGTQSNLQTTLYFHIIYYPNSDQMLFKNDAGVSTGPFYNWKTYFDIPAICADSTASALGSPTYIDCDLGECYIYLSNGKLLTVNNVVAFGSDLPVLEQGVNTITYDNTITDLKIAPRWWKL